MSLDASRLMNWKFRDVERSYTDHDTMLYALSVGLGDPPTDDRQLRFVYEKNLAALPTMPIVLGMTDLGFLSDTDVGIDLTKMLHGESQLEIHAPLPPTGTVRSRMKLVDLADKGQKKGAYLYFEREISLVDSAQALATEYGCFVLRGNGGYSTGSEDGNRRTMPKAGRTPPDRSADVVCDLATSSRSGLFYRLTNDRNPLHVDPDVARAAGFGRPILHGSCTFGVAGHAILRAVCDYDPLLFRGLAVRFTSPVFPGETIRTEIWVESKTDITFRCSELQSGRVVLDQGSAKVSSVRLVKPEKFNAVG